MELYYDLKHLLGWISTYRIIGFIPLGMILHISISAALTLILLKLGLKIKQVFVLVFLVGLSKEIMDSFVLNNTMKKHILDMCYDMSFPTLLIILDSLRAKIHNLKTGTKSND